jgi:hypothetical protein
VTAPPGGLHKGESNRSQCSILCLEAIALRCRNRPNKRAGQHDFSGGQFLSKFVKLVRQPGNAMGRMVQDSGCDAGFFDNAVFLRESR